MKKFLIKVNGKPYDVQVEEVSGDSATAIQPVKQEKAVATSLANPSDAPATEPKASAPKRANYITKETRLVIAPMPGTILKVNIRSGDTVKKGQVVLILEAMKMENEIASPVDGIVTAVNVIEGGTVCAGDLMASLAGN